MIEMQGDPLASEVLYKVDDGKTQTVWFDSHDLHVIVYLFDKFVRKEGLSDHKVTITSIYLHHDIRVKAGYYGDYIK